MRLFLKPTLILALLLLLSAQVFAADETAGDSAMNKSLLKVASGVANVATGWVEIPKNVNLAGQQKVTLASGLTAVGQGILQGTWYTINRIGCGAFDLVTFMIPTKPSVDPAFVWEDFSRETKFMGY